MTIPGDSFTQVNGGLASDLTEAVVEAVAPREGLHVVDAYAGSGPFGRAIARRGARVTSIESDPSNARGARENAAPRQSVVTGTVEDLLAKSLPAGVVVVNPPRAGLTRPVTDVLTERRVPRVVYVSCDPATLARDVSRLTATHTLDGLRAFDLFPQTPHVETIVQLTART